MDYGHKLDVLKLKYVRGMSGVILMDKWRNGNVMRREGLRKEMSDRVNQHF